MLSRTIFRACSRTLSTGTPRPNLPHISSRLPIRNTSRGFTQSSKQQARYYRYGRGSSREWTPPNYAEGARNAKPLVTVEQIRRFGRNPQTKVFGAVAVAGGVVFYVSNIEEVPVSGRKRFNCYSEESVEQEGGRMYTMIMQQNQGAVLSLLDSRHRQVQRVMNRLIKAEGLEDIDWEVNVIHSNETNAFVIPGGKVFVFTGILPVAKNDDGLAAILGHEIAHTLARHSAERMSQLVLLEPLRWALYALDWSLGGLPIGQILGSFALDLGMMRPASRTQESEADYIGLMMMAKSCYDPREAVKVWERMEKAHESQAQIPEFLSTHPANKTRITQMQGWLDKADTARMESNCGETTRNMIDFRPAVQGLTGAFRW